MKIFILLLTLFSFLFSDCSSLPKVLTGSGRTGGTVPANSSQMSSYPYWACDGSLATYYYLEGGYDFYGVMQHYVNMKTYNVLPQCPPGQIQGANGECKEPTPCAWATNPPWYPITTGGYNSVSCTPTNVNFLFGNNSPEYVGDTAYCSANATCYWRPKSCPPGQSYSTAKSKCVYPIPDSNKCPCGYYTHNYSTGIDDITKTCHTRKVCKCNPSISEDFIVSCGKKPDDSKPATGPDGPQTPIDVPDSSTPTTTDSTKNCFAAESEARMNCRSPNVLSFQCDPTLGKITKNECKAPTVPDQTQKNPGDDTKNSTTEDIKNLSNELPTKIRDALKDYFTDGSMPHLEAIRGQLQSSLILDADRNDKLDSISASADASLVLQSDANEKLDGIKSSTDGIKTSVDNVANSLKGGENSYSGDSLPTEDDLKNEDGVTDGFDVFKNSYDQIFDQFGQAQNVFGHGVPNVLLKNGTCPVLSFSFHGEGHTVDLNRIPDTISPYSSVFSILIYIALMINAFRMIFSYLSKGV